MTAENGAAFGADAGAPALAGRAARRDALFGGDRIAGRLNIDSLPLALVGLLTDCDPDQAADALRAGGLLAIGGPGAPRLVAGESAADRHLDAIAAAAEAARWAGDGFGLHLGFGLVERPRAGIEDDGGRGPALLWPVRLERRGAAAWGVRATAPRWRLNGELFALLRELYGVSADGVVAAADRPAAAIRALRPALEDTPARIVPGAALAIVDQLGEAACAALDAADEEASAGLALLCGAAPAMGAAPARAAAIETRGVEAAPPPLDLDAEETALFIDLRESDRPACAEALARESAGRAAAAAAIAAAAHGETTLYVSALPDARPDFLTALERAACADAVLPATSEDQAAGITRAALDARLKAVADAPLADAPDDDSPDPPPRTMLRDLELARKKLARYGRLMTAGFGKSGLSPHDIIWGLEHRRRAIGDLAATLDAPRPADAETLSREQIGRIRHRLDDLRAALAGDRVAAAAFTGFEPARDEPEEEIILGHFATLERAAGLLQDAVGRLRRDTGLTIAATEAAITRLRRLHAAAPPLPRHAAVDLLPGIGEPSAEAALDRFERGLREYRDAVGLVEAVFGRGWADAGVERYGPVRRLAEMAADGIDDDLRLSQLSATAADFRRGADRLRAAMAKHDEAARLLTVDAPYGGASSAMLKTCIDVAGFAPGRALHLRSPNLLKRSTAEALESARKTAAKLGREEEALNRTFTMAEVPSAEDLAEAAAALGRAGLAGPLSRVYRDARKLFQSLATDQAQAEITDGEKMAERLQTLSDWRLDVDAFASNETLRGALGPAFQGIETDFETLDALMRWLRRARDALAPADESEDTPLRLKVFNALCRAEPDVLQALARMGREAGDAFDVLGAIPDPADRAARWAAFGERILETAEAFRDADAAAEAPFGDAMAALMRIEGLRDLRRGLDEDGEAARLLKGWFRGRDTDIAPIRAARDWARRIFALEGMPDSLRRWLVSPQAVDRQERLTALLAETGRAAEDLEIARIGLREQGALDWSAWCGEPDPLAAAIRREPDDIELRAIQQRARACLAAAPHLGLWARWRAARRDLAALGLGELLDIAERGAAPLDALEGLFEFGLFQALSDTLLKSWPELEEFTRHDIRDAAAEFRQLDGQAHAHVREAHANAIAARAHRAPEADATAFRMLAESAGEPDPAGWWHTDTAPALRLLFPITLTDADGALTGPIPGERFDLVVIDRADALSSDLCAAIAARGKRCALMGDPRRGREDGGGISAAQIALGAPRRLAWARRGGAAGERALDLCGVEPFTLSTPAPFAPPPAIVLAETPREAEAADAVLRAALAGPAPRALVGLSPAARARLAAAAGDQAVAASPWGAATGRFATICLWLSADAHAEDSDGWRALAEEGGERLAASLIGAAEDRFILLAAEDAPAPPAGGPGLGLIAQAARSALRLDETPAPRPTDGFSAALTNALKQIDGAPDDLAAAGPAGPADPNLRLPANDPPLAIESDGAASIRVVTRDRERLQAEALEALGWRVHGLRSLAWRLKHEDELYALAIAMGLVEDPGPELACEDESNKDEPAPEDAANDETDDEPEN